MNERGNNYCQLNHAVRVVCCIGRSHPSRSYVRASNICRRSGCCRSKGCLRAIANQNDDKPGVRSIGCGRSACMMIRPIECGSHGTWMVISSSGEVEGDAKAKRLIGEGSARVSAVCDEFPLTRTNASSLIDISRLCNPPCVQARLVKITANWLWSRLEVDCSIAHLYLTTSRCRSVSSRPARQWHGDTSSLSCPQPRNIHFNKWRQSHLLNRLPCKRSRCRNMRIIITDITCRLTRRSINNSP
jgi:hypothetical protein